MEEKELNSIILTSDKYYYSFVDQFLLLKSYTNTKIIHLSQKGKKK